MTFLQPLIAGIFTTFIFCGICYIAGYFWEQGKKEANKKSITDKL